MFEIRKNKIICTAIKPQTRLKFFIIIIIKFKLFRYVHVHVRTVLYVVYNAYWEMFKNLTINLSHTLE